MGMVGMLLQIGIFFLTTIGMLSFWLYRAKGNDKQIVLPAKDEIEFIDFPEFPPSRK
jgi:hypothetical protein